MRSTHQSSLFLSCLAFSLTHCLAPPNIGIEEAGKGGETSKNAALTAAPQIVLGVEQPKGMWADLHTHIGTHRAFDGASYVPETDINTQKNTFFWGPNESSGNFLTYLHGDGRNTSGPGFGHGMWGATLMDAYSQGFSTCDQDAHCRVPDPDWPKTDPWEPDVCGSEARIDMLLRELMGTASGSYLENLLTTCIGMVGPPPGFDPVSLTAYAGLFTSMCVPVGVSTLNDILTGVGVSTPANASAVIKYFVRQQVTNTFTDAFGHNHQKSLVIPYDPATSMPDAYQGADGWPNARDDSSHEHLAPASIFRAYEGGLRLMVASTQDSMAAVDLWNNALVPPPALNAGHAVASGNLGEREMASARAQIDFIREVAKYNWQWMCIVTTPQEAARVISGENFGPSEFPPEHPMSLCAPTIDPLTSEPTTIVAGKVTHISHRAVRIAGEQMTQSRLAIVLAAEHDNLEPDHIMELYNKDYVRMFTPIHVADNLYGGSAVYSDTFMGTSDYFCYRADPSSPKYSRQCKKTLGDASTVDIWLPKVPAGGDSLLTHRVGEQIPAMRHFTLGDFAMNAMVGINTRQQSTWQTLVWDVGTSIFNGTAGSLTSALGPVSPNPSLIFPMPLKGWWIAPNYPVDVYQQAYGALPPGHRNDRGLDNVAKGTDIVTPADDFLRLMRAGILLDTAHMGTLSVGDTLTLAEQPVPGYTDVKYPVVFSHGGVRHHSPPCGHTGQPTCDSVTSPATEEYGDTERNLTWDHAKRLKRLGGIVGVGIGENHPMRQIDSTLSTTAMQGRELQGVIMETDGGGVLPWQPTNALAGQTVDQFSLNMFAMVSGVQNNYVYCSGWMLKEFNPNAMVNIAIIVTHRNGTVLGSATTTVGSVCKPKDYLEGQTSIYAACTGLGEGGFPDCEVDANGNTSPLGSGTFLPVVDITPTAVSDIGQVFVQYSDCLSCSSAANKPLPVYIAGAGGPTYRFTTGGWSNTGDFSPNDFNSYFNPPLSSTNPSIYATRPGAQGPKAAGLYGSSVNATVSEILVLAETGADGLNGNDTLHRNQSQLRLRVTFDPSTGAVANTPVESSSLSGAYDSSLPLPDSEEKPNVAEFIIKPRNTGDSVGGCTMGTTSALNPYTNGPNANSSGALLCNGGNQDWLSVFAGAASFNGFRDFSTEPIPGLMQTTPNLSQAAEFLSPPGSMVAFQPARLRLTTGSNGTLSTLGDIRVKDLISADLRFIAHGNNTEIVEVKDEWEVNGYSIWIRDSAGVTFPWKISPRRENLGKLTASNQHAAHSVKLKGEETPSRAVHKNLATSSRYGNALASDPADQMQIEIVPANDWGAGPRFGTYTTPNTEVQLTVFFTAGGWRSVNLLNGARWKAGTMHRVIINTGNPDLQVDDIESVALNRVGTMGEDINFDGLSDVPPLAYHSIRLDTFPDRTWNFASNANGVKSVLDTEVGPLGSSAQGVGHGIALGTDMGGFTATLPSITAGVPEPYRSQALPNTMLGRSAAPYTSPDSAPNEVYYFTPEKDGVAHYGMLADLIEALQNYNNSYQQRGQAPANGPAVKTAFNNSAQDFINTWHIASEVSKQLRTMQPVITSVKVTEGGDELVGWLGGTATGTRPGACIYEQYCTVPPVPSLPIVTPNVLGLSATLTVTCSNGLVKTYSVPTGTTPTINCAPAAGDGPANAIALPSSGGYLTTSGSVTGTTVGLANDIAPPASCSAQSGPDAFYSFTLQNTETVYFDTYGSALDTILYLTTAAGERIDTGTGVLCNDQSSCSSPNGNASRIAAVLPAGTYRLVVDGYFMTGASFTLRWTRSGAGLAMTDMLTSGVAKSGTLTAGSGSVNCVGQPDAGKGAGNELVYGLLACPNPTSTQIVTASTCNATTATRNTVLYVLPGSGGNALQCNDNVAQITGQTCSSGANASKLTGVPVAANGGLYLVVVDGRATTTSGNFSVTATLTQPAVAGRAIVQTFSSTAAGAMFGIDGAVTYPSTSCGTGFHVCSAAEWTAKRGTATPTHHYWTSDNLRFSGATGACAVSTSTGTTCTTNRPMRVCTGTPGQADGDGNTCNWRNCGLNANTPNNYFGGCSTDATSGTLCCQN